MEWNIIWDPEGLILGSLLSKVFICDILCFLENFDSANYTGDSTLSLFKCLKDCYMKVNTGKSYHLVSGNVRVTVKIDNNYLESEKEQLLLSITILSTLTCKWASQKLKALGRFSPSINTLEWRIIMKSFVKSEIVYSP